MPQPSHPLTGYRRFGVVADISTGPGNLIGVDIGGDNAGNDWDSGQHEYCAPVDSYEVPTVGDAVMLLGIPGDWVIVGRVGGGSRGVIGYGTGPSTQTDFGTGGGSAVTLTLNVIQSRRYRLSAYLVGTWITNPGYWTAKVNAAGVEVARLAQENNSTSVVQARNIDGVYLAGATASVTFTLTSQATAGALRVAANQSWLMVEDRGVF